MSYTSPMQVDSRKAWIQTFTGGQFHILDPQQSEIHIEDIAHALSMMCRFTGHVREFYSVAEHSVYTSNLVPAQDAFWALMHDAPEAYIADINRPLKHYTNVGPTYIAIEQRIMAAIAEKFNLGEEPESIRTADNMMLYAEKAQLLHPLDWDSKWADSTKAAEVFVQCWSPREAEYKFLDRFNELNSNKG